MSAQGTAYVDEGLRVLLCEDNFIYVVNESDNLVYVYNAEMWIENWIDASPVFDMPPVQALIPYAHKHTPSRLAKRTCNHCEASGPDDQMTLAEWESKR